jgi:hypothetical protein
MESPKKEAWVRSGPPRNRMRSVTIDLKVWEKSLFIGTHFKDFERLSTLEIEGSFCVCVVFSEEGKSLSRG